MTAASPRKQARRKKEKMQNESNAQPDRRLDLAIAQINAATSQINASTAAICDLIKMLQTAPQGVNDGQ
jgi:hypothetical protein